jgi:hypothetical protein
VKVLVAKVGQPDFAGTEPYYNSGWLDSKANFSVHLSSSVAPGGQVFAFRLRDAHLGAKSGSATLYVLRRGANRAEPIFRHHLGPSGCAVGANLNWHGRARLQGSQCSRV